MSRDPHVALKNALVAYLGPLDFGASRTWDWASITFDGMRHELSFTLPWSENIQVAVEALPDVDLPMPGAFIASIVPVSLVRSCCDLCVCIEALTIVD